MNSGHGYQAFQRKLSAFQRKMEKAMGTFLSERELSELTAPDNTAFPSPVPLQMVSNGEFNREHSKSWGRLRGH
jgi:hypothetical protein